MTKNTYKTLELKHPAEHVLQLTLNRPFASNAFNTAMAQELCDFFETLTTELPEHTRVVVLTGKGTRAFCAGGDLKERHGMSNEAWFAQHRVYERMVRAIIGCPLPIIAAVNGAAFGGGCELVAAVDFAYAARTATFAQTETTLGIMPGAGGTQCLPRAIGVKRAQELILSGRRFSAEEAESWGLVNAVFEPELLLANTLKMASTIADNAPIAVRQSKLAVNRGMDMSLANGLGLEIEAYNRLVPTEDRREGISSYNERREPKFEGR